MKKDTLKFGEDLQRKLTGFTTSFIDYIKSKSTSAAMQTIIGNLQVELLIWSSAPANEVDASLNYNLEPLHITPTYVHCINTVGERDAEQLKKLISESGTYVFSPVSEIPYNNTPKYTDSFCVIFATVIPDQSRVMEKIIINVLLDFLAKCLNNLDALTATDLTIWEKNEQKFNFNILAACKQKIFCEMPIPREEIINKISYQPYERSEIYGNIYFIDRYTYRHLRSCNKTGLAWITNKNDNTQNMDNPQNISYVRKLLETCKSGNILLVCTEARYRIVAIANQQLVSTIPSCYKLEFKGRGKWRLCIDGHIIENNSEDNNHVNKNILDKVKKIKPIAPKHQPLFEKIFECLYQCPHGALMIVGEAGTIQPEAKRLSALHKGTMITNNFDLKNPENLPVVQGLASVDGAIMVDYSGICHGFGIILDGEAVIKGETGRGSRYNSAQNYAALHQEYAVVFSEDKDRGIDVVNGADLAAELGL